MLKHLLGRVRVDLEISIKNRSLLARVSHVDDFHNLLYFPLGFQLDLLWIFSGKF